MNIRVKRSWPIQFLLGVMRYVHYTIGITTPPPEQEMRALTVWIVGMAGMIGLTIAFFFFLMTQFPAR